MYFFSSELSYWKEKIRRKTEASFCYANIEDFNKVAVTTLWENRGVSFAYERGITLLKTYL